MQTSLNAIAEFRGLGLHSGKPALLRVLPAERDHGIVFVRVDMADAAGGNVIPALWDHVEPSRLCTKLTNGNGVDVSTVEHIMAALAGCGITNARVEIDGPEVPILDGSSAYFVAGLLRAGLNHQDGAQSAIIVKRAIEVVEGEAVARLEPHNAFEIDFHIDFDDAAIGVQGKRLNMANGAFVRELSDCRTFCRKADIDWMLANGLARGGSLDNAVVVDGADVLSPGGFRVADEAVRHKMLDALGDLALAGHPIFGRYSGQRAGHAMTNRLLHALFADPANYAIETCSPAMQMRLPGVGVGLHDLAPAFANAQLAAAE